MQFSRLTFIVTTDKKHDNPPAILHNKHNRRNKIKFTKSELDETIIKWRLDNFVEKKKPGPNDMEFFPWGSGSCLHNGLTTDQVVEFINSELIFEDYEPQQNDFLKIWMELKYQGANEKIKSHVGNYISFIFNKKWIANEMFDHLHNIYKHKFEGDLLIE